MVFWWRLVAIIITVFIYWPSVTQYGMMTFIVLLVVLLADGGLIDLVIVGIDIIVTTLSILYLTQYSVLFWWWDVLLLFILLRSRVSGYYDPFYWPVTVLMAVKVLMVANSSTVQLLYLYLLFSVTIQWWWLKPSEVCELLTGHWYYYLWRIVYPAWRILGIRCVFIDPNWLLLWLTYWYSGWWPVIQAYSYYSNIYSDDWYCPAVLILLLLLFYSASIIPNDDYYYNVIFLLVLPITVVIFSIVIIRSILLLYSG